MLAASGSRMCVSPALIDHQHGAAVTQVPYAQSRIEPGARCKGQAFAASPLQNDAK